MKKKPKVADIRAKIAESEKRLVNAKSNTLCVSLVVQIDTLRWVLGEEEETTLT